MRIYLAAIALTGTLLAGCSSDWDSSRNATSATAVEAREKAGLPVSTLAARETSVGFASLPDRGALLNYSRDREIRRAGAYTSHPVQISEAHALNAIAAGGLRLDTPDGKPVNVAFERIEEHPDGNWTWVGQSDSGDHAVLTFGESAVFGEFSSGGKSFRVTTRHGNAWVVETDPTLLAGNHPGQHGDGPEFLIPPASVDTLAGAAGAKAMAAAESTVAQKNSTSVVDLALGYTNGMVATYGNQATAITRLTSLVALGNAAYQRSGVNMQIRLVHAAQVNFPDNTLNADALQKLTGYNQATSQFITPDPAFNALRAARDEFGADLVAVVRQHRSPEQEGCGIAWLIGANQRAITAADAPFGYSVVSDGSDLDETNNNTYYCSDYSLIHELGHSMGQAHNQQNSQYVGAHAYSYGYRETSASGFHTIMAYPLLDGSQVEIPYFANPAISFSGRPTGVANASDNARSLNLTMPIIATFRATMVPLGNGVRNDVDGDGMSDLLWSSPARSEFRHWLMNGAAITASVTTPINSVFDAIGSGDFNGDGRTDVVWRHRTNGGVFIWERTASGYTTKAVTGVPDGWSLVGTGDINGDGKHDMIWSRPGQLVYWIMDSATISSTSSFALDTNYDALATGDFNGDGRQDVVWRHRVNGAVYIWEKNAGDTGFTTRFLQTLPSGWNLVGAGDINLDGKDDMLFSRPPSSQFVQWVMNGGVISSQSAFAIDSSYDAIGLGDFNGDGRTDVVWRHRGNGAVYFWEKRDTSGYLTRAVGTVESGWHLLR